MAVTLWATRNEAEAVCDEQGGSVLPVANSRSWVHVPPAETVPPAWLTGARTGDPDTSSSTSGRAKRGLGQRLVLAALRTRPKGLTDFGLAAVTGVKQTSIGKRRGELRDAGLVEDSGRREQSDTGASAIVWTLTTEGREMADQQHEDER